MLFSPAVRCALLACCWLCSSRLLFAMLFGLLLAMLLCHFVQLSEILVDLLLVVVQVLRLCAPFRQSGFASFVDFLSPLALLGVVPSVLCLLASPPPALLCGSLLLRGSPQAPPAPLLSIAPHLHHWFAVRVPDPQHRNLQQRGLLFVKSGFTPSGRFVASAVGRWSPTPLCDTLVARILSTSGTGGSSAPSVTSASILILADLLVHRLGPAHWRCSRTRNATRH